MPRFKLTIEYDGAGFVGWQRQENGLSVQEVLEDAVYKLSGERVSMIGAGRTDSRVHALGQVAHFDLEGGFTPHELRDALNFHVKPAAISVLAAESVGADFHARFSARERAYLYRIVNRRPPLSLERGRAWLVRTPLDAQVMHRAAQLLVGRHDFSSFRSSHCQAKSPLKTLKRLAVARQGDEIRITARARSFLHNQVRIIAGTLKQVGEGKMSVDDVAAALAARDRKAAGQTAPPDGLYLVEVVY